MRHRFVPVGVSLLLALATYGFWHYPTTGRAPVWLLGGYPVVIVVLAAVGCVSALAQHTHRAISIAHIVFLAVFVAGAASFYILTAPTTINVFGYLAVVAGLLGASITALFFLSPRRA